MENKIKDTIITVAVLIVVALASFYLGNLYNQYKNVNSCKYEKNLDGLFTMNKNYSVAMNVAKDRDEYGDWVCVNIRDMDFNRGLQVCRHEVFHEIWAECGESNNLSYCINDYESFYTNKTKLDNIE